MNKIKPIYILIFVCIIGLGLRIYFAQFLTFVSDLDLFKYWSYYLADKGFGTFYANIWSDYLPGYHYVLWSLGKIRLLLINNSIYFNETILYKLPSIIADILNTIFIFLIAKKFTTGKKALITSLLYLVNPAFMANSTFWGQADSFLTLFIIASFYTLLSNKLIISALLLGFAIVIKPIAILSVPIYLLYLIRPNNLNLDLKKPFIYSILLSLTVLLSFLPFNYMDNIFTFIQSRLNQTFNQYPFTSLNAFNFWAITPGFWISDKITFLNLSYQLWGNIILGIICLSVSLVIIKQIIYRKTSLVLFSLAMAIIYTAMFIFLTRIHERHSFPGLALVILNFMNLPKLGRILALIVSLIYVLNLLYPYYLLYQNKTLFSQFQIIIFSSINILMLFYLLIIFFWKYGKISRS